MSAVSASRALLAHYNNQMAAKLVRHVLRESSPAVRKRVADAVLDLIPKALSEKVYPLVEKATESAVSAYFDGSTFKETLRKSVEAHADGWLKDALDRAMREKAQFLVASYVKGYSGQQLSSTIPGALQIRVQEEISKQAALMVEKSNKK